MSANTKKALPEANSEGKTKQPRTESPFKKHSELEKSPSSGFRKKQVDSDKYDVEELLKRLQEVEKARLGESAIAHKKIEELGSSMEEIKNQLVSSERDKQYFKNQLEEVKNISKNKLESVERCNNIKVESLNREIEVQSETIISLKQKNAEQLKQIQQLKENCEFQNLEISTHLEATHHSLQQKYSSLKDLHEQLKSEYLTLKNEHEKYVQENISSKNSEQGFLEKISLVQIENEKLKSNMISLEMQNEKQLYEINKLNSQLKDRESFSQKQELEIASFKDRCDEKDRDVKKLKAVNDASVNQLKNEIKLLQKRNIEIESSKHKLLQDHQDEIQQFKTKIRDLEEKVIEISSQSQDFKESAERITENCIMWQKRYNELVAKQNSEILKNEKLHELSMESESEKDVIIKQLREEIEKIKVNMFKKEEEIYTVLVNLKTERENLKSKNTELVIKLEESETKERYLKEMQDALTNYENEIEELKSKLIEISSIQRDELQSALLDQQNTIERRNFEDEINKLKSELVSAKDEADTFRETNNKLMSLIKLKEQELSNFESKFEENEIARNNDIQKHLQSVMKHHAQVLQSREREIESLKTEVRTFDEIRANLNLVIAQLKESLEELRIENEILKTNMKKSTAQSDGQKVELTQKLASYNELLGSKYLEIEETKKDNENLQNQISSFAINLKTWKTHLTDLILGLSSKIEVQTIKDDEIVNLDIENLIRILKQVCSLIAEEKDKSIQDLRAYLAEVESNLLDTQTELSKQLTKYREVKEKIKAKKESWKQKKEAYKSRIIELEAIKDPSDTVNQVNEAEKEKRFLNQEIQRLREKINDLESQNQNFQKTLDLKLVASRNETIYWQEKYYHDKVFPQVDYTIQKNVTESPFSLGMHFEILNNANSTLCSLLTYLVNPKAYLACKSNEDRRMMVSIIKNKIISYWNKRKELSVPEKWLAPAQTIEEYLSNLNTEANTGGYIDLIAISNAVNIEFVIFKLCSGNITVERASPNNSCSKRAFLIYNMNAKSYPYSLIHTKSRDGEEHLVFSIHDENSYQQSLLVATNMNKEFKK